MVSSHKRFSIMNRRTGDFTNFRLRKFLDENNVELVLGLKEGVDDERIFTTFYKRILRFFTIIVKVHHSPQNESTWIYYHGSQHIFFVATPY